MAGYPHFQWVDLFKKDRNDKQTIGHILKKNILFSTLNSRELSHLSGLVYERVYQPDELVFRQNDRGLGMYVISQGSVAIRSQSSKGEVLVTTLKEGSFFGEMALTDPDNLRTASAVTMERTTLIGFFVTDLREILERKPEMGVKILIQLSFVLAKRLQETTKRIAGINAIQETSGGDLEEAS